MKNYKIICIDMFQTLVNVESRVQHIWKRILEEDYNEELKEKYVKIVKTKIVDKFHINAGTKIKFKSLKEIFLASFDDIFKENNAKYCPRYSTKVFMQEHDNAELYHDSIEFVNRAKKNYKVCLVSDADFEMVENQVKRFNFDNFFISEKSQSYKGEPNNKIFKEVINHYNVSPNQIIHIGDSSSDIIGANRAGINTCWINRHNYKKRFDIKPDHEVKSLMELYPILDI
jgi:putative hydrolase of the HAD superfamily